MATDARAKKGRKYDQVLSGAREVFLQDGFEGASVDTIAKCAGVSKATLYSYFPDKRDMFIEVASAECGRQADEAVRQLDLTAPPEVVLERAGTALMNFMLSEPGQRVFRIVLAECERFPEIGQAFWDAGPGLIETMLCDYFDSAVDRGELRIDDRALAAHQFAELCKAELFPRICLRLQADFTEAERCRILNGAIATWLARYGTRPAP